MSTFDRSSPVHWLAFGLGSGLVPKARGTLGTLAGVPLWWLLAQMPWAGYLLATAIIAGAGIGICGRTARDLGVHDHGGIVWDEIAGYLVTMILAPVTPLSAAAGFVLFRLFDIAKPWPIGWLDARVGGGTGIMVDDLLAGVYAAVILQLLGLLPV